MRTAIEQARARGLDVHATAELLATTPAAVHAVWDDMDEMAVELDVATALTAREDLEVGPAGRLLEPHGTHAAFNRHKKRGEHPCAECRVGERRWQAESYRQRQARRALSSGVPQPGHLRNKETAA